MASASRSSRAKRRPERPPSGDPPRPVTTSWWPIAAIVVAGLLVYANSLDNPFVLDDQLSVQYSQAFGNRGLAGLLFAEPDTPAAGRPLVHLSFAINDALGGVDVGGYRVWNIGVHLLCALLLFGIARRTLEHVVPIQATIGSPSNIAFAAALIWTVHPLNSEVVNYITQRTESMMALCYLGALYASIRALRSGRRTTWEAIAIVVCALGMMCKESMVTAPIVVVLYDRLFVFSSFREGLGARTRLYVGLALTWLILVALIWSAPRGASAGFSSGVTPWEYLLNQAVMIGQYLRLALWPRALVAAYGWPTPVTIGDVLPQLALIAGLLVLTGWALVRRPWIGFIGAWYFITLAPASSIVPIASEVGAERRMYLPLAGLVVLAVVGVVTLVGRLGRRQRQAAGALALIGVSTACGVATISRNREYRSELVLMQTSVERWPNAFAYQLLGTRLLIEGDPEQAMVQLRAAAPGAPRARHDLGIALFNAGRFDEATGQFETFIAIAQSPPIGHPYRQPPLTFEVLSARTYLGRVRMRQQQWVAAVEQFRIVLSADPRQVETRGLLAEALFRQEQYADAAAEYERYLAARPGNVGVMTNLAIALDLSGQPDEALAVFRRIVEIAPQDGSAHFNLATNLLDRGFVDEAAVHAQQAAALMGDDAASALLRRARALQGRPGGP